MDADRAVDVLLILGMLVLVGGSIAVRRLPARSMALMAIAWIAVFALGVLLIRMFGGD
ncbi:hypothetical protein [Sphingomonas quercus]|uniref:Uncharacterized protein n=1 Tax=Sphingomonas quercus TaxID=2842451 RepID=A0ABS6BD44_9SPHN|nr:hypothetical protein [Sphingomonas quercus]MBU3076250.1 hypothetical protein [Sphingomonas quercus]